LHYARENKKKIFERIKEENDKMYRFLKLSYTRRLEYKIRVIGKRILSILIYRIAKYKQKEGYILDCFKNNLKKIDSKIIRLSSKEIQRELDKIPLDIYGRILIERPQEYSNLINWLPELPSPEIQKAWNGDSDYSLMIRSVAFIRTVVLNFCLKNSKPLNEAKVLDFGCGWGRLVRMLYKYVDSENIYAVDPWDQSIRMCINGKVHGNFYISDDIPRSLPTPKNLKFDLIIAFSVFTHLPEKSLKIALRTLCNSLSDNGIMVISIRPREYWENYNNINITDEKLKEILKTHAKKGFAFVPHNREKINGEIVYGDASISLEYIKNNFDELKILNLDWCECDPYQVVVILEKSIA